MDFVADNNVLVQVHTQCLAGATSIRLKPLTGVPPWKMPPAPTSARPKGAITLMDRLDSSAAKTEIVHYTARVDNGDGTYTYTVTRGQEGTTARQWEAGEWALQIPTVAGGNAAAVWNEVGAVGQPAFENGWQNFGSGWDTAGFYLDADENVHLKGLVKSGVVGQAIFTLPAGYRPASNRAAMFAVSASGAFGELRVSTSGAVLLNVGTTTYVSLNSIFRGGA